MPFLVIIPVVIVSSIPISLLLGVFALRLRGVYFAIATLAFGYMAQKTFFQSYLGVQGGFGGTDSKAITRPAGFQSSEGFYYLLIGSLLLMALICWAVNKSWIGTSLTALRESEAAFSVLGHSPGAYKMFTICLSGAIATVAGAYFGMLQGLVPSNYFQPALAVLYFGFAVAGGMGSVGGACVAGIAFGAIPKYFDSLSEGKLVGYDQFFIGVVALAVVLWAPGGFAAIGRRIWRRLEGSPAGRAGGQHVRDRRAGPGGRRGGGRRRRARRGRGMSRQEIFSPEARGRAGAAHGRARQVVRKSNGGNGHGRTLVLDPAKLARFEPARDRVAAQMADGGLPTRRRHGRGPRDPERRRPHDPLRRRPRPRRREPHGPHGRDRRRHRSQRRGEDHVLQLPVRPAHARPGCRSPSTATGSTARPPPGAATVSAARSRRRGSSAACLCSTT